MRRLKTVMAVAVWIVVLALGWFTVRALRESVALDRSTDEVRRETARCEKALEIARREAREVVREKLNREETAARKADAESAERSRAAASARRAKARRFFASRGFEASASYRQAVAMPRGDPAEEDQEIIDLAGEAACEADLDTAAEVLEAALESKDPRARLSAVEMLSGLGEAGLTDISAFLADPHPDVANLAADRWELGIQDLTDEREQAALAKVGFLAITDEDQLRSLGGTLMLVSDSKLAIDVVKDVIRDGTSAQRAAAREAYESVTGEAWVDEAAAMAWLAENYEPPEPEEAEPEEPEPEEPEPEEYGESEPEEPEDPAAEPLEDADDFTETKQTQETEDGNE